MKKRGEANVGGFIALIAFFLLVFVVLLNPEEKEKLFDTEKGMLNNGVGPIEQGKVLLSITPGYLSPDRQNTVIQNFPTVELFSNVESENIMLANSVSIRRTIFNNEKQEYEFKLKDPRAVESVSILFLVLGSSGNLILSLNGKEFFNGKVSTGDLPVNIPRNLLSNDNTLTMEVSSPGLAFLSRNFYNLKDLQLVIKTFRQNKREIRTFVLTDDEYENIARARLFYFINCMKVRETGLLNIFVNDRLVSTKLVVCDAKPVQEDIDVRVLREGRNEIRFEIDKGEYALEQVVLQKEFRQRGYPNHYFAVQRDDIEEMHSYGANAILGMEFVDDGYRKAGTIILNGGRIYFDTLSYRFEYDVSELIREGENILRIVPRSDFEVLSLDIILE